MTDLNKPGSEERAIAQAEIRAICHRYAVMARDKVDFKDMEPLFRPDGLFRLPNGVAVKPSEISTVVQGEEAKYIRHHITSIDIHFTSDTEARTKSQFFAATNVTFTDHWGCWEDIFTRDENGAWLIYDRSIVIDGYDPKGWYGEKYGGPSCLER
ncbi:uncharacterized protein A1O9_02184 [Exophiala aquamarina CBS 119918]|uniref:SnoaL-like domain-containing protein n=1 Tax=Exophiala aquamarina CBS 119918 TaxID=1182545 RepID=A0A072PMP8_9EURO|nr:uncharacterized protein A1O9_02184 [Exophiala aquamarina CBS 119918]KEF60623.1 hypothetical protein A1O9_02184 [Exophiala aquamarina CBS 119918]